MLFVVNKKILINDIKKYIFKDLLSIFQEHRLSENGYWEFLFENAVKLNSLLDVAILQVVQEHHQSGFLRDQHTSMLILLNKIGRAHV